MRQGDMILRMARESVSEPNDLADIQTRYDRLKAATGPVLQPGTAE
jgi:hypothetical protein